MASQSFNVGIIGYGMSAKVFHIPLVQHVDGLNLYAVLQRAPKPDSDVTKDHPHVKHYTDLPGLLGDAAVDLVVVTSTPETHYDMASAALDAGKHVVVEKPLAPTSKECEELVQKAAKVGKMLTVYQNRRWDLDFLTLQSVMRSGALGRIVDFESHMDRYRPAPPTNWKAKPTPGNGVIYDLGAHLLDQVVVLFGLPARVTGFVYSQRDDGAARGAEDSCTVLLHYPKIGLTATVKAAVISPDTEQLRFWVRGMQGGFKKYGVDTQEDALKKGATPSDAGFGTEPEEQYGALTTADPNGKLQRKVHPSMEPETYTAFYTGVLAALRGTAGPPVDPTVAAQVIKIIELAVQSSEEGRTVKVD